MSYEFRVRPGAPLDVERVYEGLRALGIACTYEPILRTLICARLESSLRPVRAEIGDDEATVFMNAYSSPSDYAVALDLVEALMRSPESRFQPESFTEWFPREELRKRFPESWTREERAGPFAVLAAQVMLPGMSIINVAGTRHDIVVGRTFVRRFSKQEAPRAVERAFHRLQHIEEEGYVVAEHVRLAKDNDRVTASVWDPRRATVIRSPDVHRGGLDFVQVEDAGERILFPASALQAVVGADLEPLDEVSVAVPARSADEVPGCLARAREHARKVRVRRARRGRGLPLRTSRAVYRLWSIFFLLLGSTLFVTYGAPALGGEPGTTAFPVALSVMSFLCGGLSWFLAKRRGG